MGSVWNKSYISLDLLYDFQTEVARFQVWKNSSLITESDSLMTAIRAYCIAKYDKHEKPRRVGHPARLDHTANPDTTRTKNTRRERGAKASPKATYEENR